MPPSESGLHQIPVTEEHGVGHRPQEDGTDEGPRCGEEEWTTVGVGGEHETDDTDYRRDEIESGRELVRRTVALGRGALDAGHRRDACGAPFDQRPLTADTSASACDADDERADRCDPDEQRGDAPPSGRTPRDGTGGERPQRHDDVHTPQQPPVAEADLAPSPGDPQEQQAADRPLQQHRRTVEADHCGGLRRSSAHSTSPIGSTNSTARAYTSPLWPRRSMSRARDDGERHDDQGDGDGERGSHSSGEHDRRGSPRPPHQRPPAVRDNWNV